MFNKEELSKIQEQLDNLDKKYQEGIKEIKDFEEKKFNQIEELFSEINKKQSTLFEEFEKSISTFNDMNIKYKKEFDTFNVIKNNLTSKTLEKLEKELKDELKVHFDKLDLERKKFEELSKSIEVAKDEVKRLTLLSEKIKEADLNLVKHAQELKSNEDEKLRMMKRIDDLQTLIAKMRQGRHS